MPQHQLARPTILTQVLPLFLVILTHHTMAKASPPSSLFTDSKKIIVAAKAGDIDCVMALCGRMPSRSSLLNTRTTVKGETPLIKAVQYGHRELARWLMMVGADPYIADSGGKGAFQVCIHPLHSLLSFTLFGSGHLKRATMTSLRRCSSASPSACPISCLPSLYSKTLVKKASC